MVLRLLIIATIILCASCNNEAPEEGFTVLPAKRTGIDFRNMLNETEDFNIFKYQYFYNGGGVSLADYNNDGLEDIFFTGNMVKNRLFLNEGDFRFKNITINSGVAAYQGWCTGSNAVDINQDGWMDLYVCRAGYPFPKLRTNLLFINNKDNTFTESAEKYGLADPAYSTHSAFFDYDKDGDLDLFLVNHSTPEYSKGNLEATEQQKIKDPKNTNKLYRNNGGYYNDISQEAGINGNVLSFSLGIAILDANHDNWPDVYITNDFNEPDYIYINQKDGTFKESASQHLMNQSKFAMGVDVADIDQNGLQDIVVLDMLPESNELQKMHMGADNFDKIELFVKKGFQKQHSRNTVQLSYNATKMSEVGQALGLSNTDWSWSPLVFDFDNDMHQDIFISNGYMRDHTDLDFLQYTADLVQKLNKSGANEYEFEEYVSSMPAIDQPNYFYQRQGGKFNNKSVDWGLNIPSVSQGAAYADLDQDGDLDLVTNNSGAHAYVYQNDHPTQNWITFQLEGDKGNADAIGAKLVLSVAGKIFVKYLQPSRGFQSSSTYDLHFGLGSNSSYEGLKIIWPDGTEQSMAGGKCCSKVVVKKKKGSSPVIEVVERKLFGKPVFPNQTWKHEVEEFRDFTVQKLMPFYQTDISPQVEVADLDNDGREDVIVSGSAKNETVIYWQNNKGEFSVNKLLEQGLNISDIEIADIDGDGYKDILMTSGSYQYTPSQKKNKLITFTNKGKRGFNKSTVDLDKTNPSSLAVADFDGNGTIDIFCSGDYWQGGYPVSSPSVMLTKIDTKWLLNHHELGNIKSVATGDINNDKVQEIVVAGHWNNPQILNLSKGDLDKVTQEYIDELPTGFWNTVTITDMDNDGDQDILLGNIGINNQLNASPTLPLRVVVEDIDDNGSLDPVMSYNIDTNTYPHPSREDILLQVPSLKKKYVSFNDYATVDYNKFLVDAKLDQPKELLVEELRHIQLTNVNSTLSIKSLPLKTQMSPVYDINYIGKNFHVLVGNKNKNLVKIGNLTSSQGKLWNGKSNSTEDTQNTLLSEEYRSSATIIINGKPHIVLCPIGGQLTFQAINHE